MTKYKPGTLLQEDWSSYPAADISGTKIPKFPKAGFFFLVHELGFVRFVKLVNSTNGGPVTRQAAQRLWAETCMKKAEDMPDGMMGEAAWRWGLEFAEKYRRYLLVDALCQPNEEAASVFWGDLRCKYKELNVERDPYPKGHTWPKKTRLCSEAYLQWSIERTTGDCVSSVTNDEAKYSTDYTGGKFSQADLNASMEQGAAPASTASQFSFGNLAFRSHTASAALSQPARLEQVGPDNSTTSRKRARSDSAIEDDEERAKKMKGDEMDCV